MHVTKTYLDKQTIWIIQGDKGTCIGVKLQTVRTELLVCLQKLQQPRWLQWTVKGAMQLSIPFNCIHLEHRGVKLHRNIHKRFETIFTILHSMVYSERIYLWIWDRKLLSKTSGELIIFFWEKQKFIHVLDNMWQLDKSDRNTIKCKKDRQCTCNWGGFVQSWLQGKNNNTPYSRFTSVALGNDHVLLIRIVICDLSGSIIFFYVIWKTGRFSKKKSLIMQYLFRFALQIFLQYFSL